MPLNQDQPDQEMIAVKVDAFLGPLEKQLADLCKCIREANQVVPCDAFPFLFKGSVTQTAVCFVAATGLQVPKGMIGTITKIAFAERYPGSLYGANFYVLINDNIAPNLPRFDHAVGSLQTPQGFNICLQDQDIVSVMVQCSWTPVQFTGIASTYIQMLFPFEISGYFQYKNTAESSTPENIA